MDWISSMQPVTMSPAAVQKELARCNQWTETFGLKLTEQQMLRLTQRRLQALRATGRMEFGDGALQKLVYAFCDSPYVNEENYEATLAELLDIFYYFKNESEERLSDDALVEAMRRLFNGEAGGSTDFLAGKALEELCQKLRRGERFEDALGEEQEEAYELDERPSY